MLTAAD